MYYTNVREYEGAIQNKQSRETEGDNKEWTNQRNCHHRAHKTQDVTPSK
jgi:hypothetical protein